MDNKPVFDMVLFGGTGDLVMRKLLPSLYQAHAAGLLNQNGRLWALGRKDLGRDAYLQQVEAEARIHIKHAFDAAQWQSFCQRIDYIQLDANDAAGFQRLAAALAAQEKRGEVICYLSTAPRYFTPICRHLAAVGLNGSQVRVVLEKPLGTDLASSNAINDAVAEFFNETQIYRIDHYLGKESV